MMLYKFFSAICLLFCCTASYAQALTATQYIEMYKEIAISEMKRLGVPASIILAQGILETESGNSDLVRRSNNHFGIKCKSTWTGESVYHDDDALGECFRKYNNARESYKDHSDFLRNNQRYGFLFTLDPTDYKAWAYGLKKAGYATNPRYPQILISSIEMYNLNQYTLLALGQDTGTTESNTVSDQTGNNIPSLDKRYYQGLKAVYAASGTSLLAIATRYEVSLSKLMEFNDLSTEGLLPFNTWIFLEKKHKQSIQETYTTNGTESVNDIAQINAIQLPYLLEYNNLKIDEPVPPGTVVRLKPVAVSQTLVMETTVKFHTVQPKEGLYAISKKYKVSVDEIKEWNQLQTDNVRVGQKLIISK